MLKPFLFSIALSACTSFASAASNCDDSTAQIDAKVRAAGVTQFTLTTVAADATVSGKVVGTCERGSRKIVYEAQAGASSPPPPRSNDGILTECKDGSVSIGGDCKK